ncbi:MULTISPECIES: two-partner secretion domain-containing protein [unclassified Tolypothrix]|uniref:two-partner secretion domain-containing protein n=1 Tax=unclassified Tolypothrix TaxID=2649714 RepID=UPI0005EABAC7|nr:MULTISPECIES: filamentous hemagglutinin N-terminal domain-containing protein [unclassified Tolypothrix]BAY92237.1 filamentous hemagglutinin outer membrane protein [Microchaete diplosiphon NIES-3275]EKE98510.1 protein, filamentous hemagglutinin family [Tolypothrix sp. PCC 7601]MBE9083055.1 filamentous hemagglutinin N-terminal domain-containing protein [Tolypothrix sp. LEGE 11397]UYD26210.1 filamentous hemagglutinin N-terminal domain-containing protein [Tolypothrix sp. PCC 7712]UYD31552.1 fil
MPEIQNFFKKFFIPSLFVIVSTPAKAQITPDNTLGAEASSITPNTLINGENADLINGGAQRGSNLFHSFTEFNINDGQRVYFGNPSGVQNILTRVTGVNASNILGTLGVNGIANLFLINPNGIVFGNNASLDIRGSFLATTANALQFGNQGIFSATNPQAPPLLTVNPSALLFNQINQNAAIQNNSVAAAGIDPAGVNVLGLRVPDGKSLLLVGGNVSMDGGWAIANGGRIELGGLKEAGSIGIQTNGDNFSLSFPDGVQRGDISLNNAAVVGVIGDGGGSIAAHGRNIEILAGSEFFAGIGLSLGNANAQAGDITVDATGKILLAGTDSLIFNSVQSQAVGNAGNITIKTGSLEITDGAQINSFTRGEGNAGNITIQARDAVTFDGVDSNGFPSGVFSNVATGGVGNGGNIGITSGSLSITNGGNIQVAVREASNTLLGGQGIGGTVNINVRDAVTLSGAGSTIFGSLGTGATGRAGDIKVEARNLFIKDGGEISSSTFGKGDSGDIFITANAISLDAASYIYNNVQSSDAVGNAGNIDIATGSLTATNGAQINSFTRGQGNAGNITIQARDAVTFDGVDSNGFPSGSFSDVSAGAVGNGGVINITASSLSLTNSGILGVSLNRASGTLAGAQGIGGTININVRDAFTISGTDSGIFGSLGAGAIGSGGNIKVEAGNIFVRDGGEISASTFGKGDSGNIYITADKTIFLDYSSYILNNVQAIDAEGNAGNIDILTGSLSVTNGAQINSFTRGQGNAGNITIQARDAVTFDGVDSNGFPSASLSNVFAGAVGNGGVINITASSLSLTNSGILGVSLNRASGTLAGAQGIGGTVNINVRDVFAISGANSGIFGSLGDGASGSAGNIKVEAGNINIKEGGEIISSTFGKGNSGNIFITGRDAISLDATSYIINNIQSIDAEGSAGNINISTGSLSLTNGSQINSFTRGRGNGGNITIQARDTVSFVGLDIDESPSGLFSNVESGAFGNGGDINIFAENVFIKDGAVISSSTFGEGDAGKISITARDTVSLSGKSFSRILNSVDSGGVGNSGGISINTGSLFASDEARILSSISGRGNSGGIFIEARNTVSLTGVGDLNLGRTNFDADGTIFSSSVNFGGVGNSGGVVIKTGTLRLDSSQINASTAGTGNSGNIIIEARDQVALVQGSDMFSEVTCACEDNGGGVGGIGNGGDIQITTGSFLLDIGANLRADTEARGNGGNIIINARDSVTFSGDLKPFWGGAYTQVEPEAVGKGGDIIINTPNLSVSGNQEINTRTQGQGDAGNILINANSIAIAGSDVFITSGASQDGRLSGTLGKGGDINISTNSLLVTDGAKLSANTEIQNAAGNININASRLTLNNRGSITSESIADANGGNIKLNVNDFLLMRRGAQISTTAGTTQAGGNGGNITINTPFIVAVPNENSDITANAFSGAGGNINIFTQNIFGIDSRLKPSLQTNDITASSELGVQGQIEIQQPEVQPTQELIQLPNEFIDASTKFSQICPTDPNPKPLAKFVVTGRGSLPPSPLELLTGTNIHIPLATLEEQTATSIDGVVPVSNNAISEIIEAQGMVKTANGEIALVTNAPQATPTSHPVATVCPVSR